MCCAVFVKSCWYWQKPRFKKKIHLLEGYSFKYLRYVGKNTSWAIFSLFSLSFLLMTGFTSANLSWFVKQSLSNKVLKILVSTKMQESTQPFSIPPGISPVRFTFFPSMFKITFLTSFSLTEWNLKWHSSLFKEKSFLMLEWSLKVSVILGTLLLVNTWLILGFRSKVLVILIKCVLKISDNLQSSETMQSFYEIIILLERFPLSEKYGLIVCQWFLLSGTSFGFNLF